MRIYGVGEFEGLPYLVMEWVEGGDLAERLRHGVFQPSEAAALVLPLAQALQAAHDQGVIHRDLKPSNILLAHASSSCSRPACPSRGVRLEPKIGDFGLAKLVEYDAKATQIGAAIGTPHYMAPEQTGLVKHAQQGPATDIYGLGAILYEMLIGHPPFEGATRRETIRNVVSSEVVSPRGLRSSVPRDLETICLKCLERDPSQRYASSGALADDLERFLEGRPIRSRRIRSIERGARWCRRNPIIAGLLASLIAVFLAGFAAVTVQWRRANAEATRANHTARAAAEARDAELRLRIRADRNGRARLRSRAGTCPPRGSRPRTALDGRGAARDACRTAGPGAVGSRQPDGLESSVCSLRAILEHRGAVHQATFRSDGKVVLTGSVDGTAQMWDSSSGRPLLPPMRHGDQVLSIAFSPDGRLALTGGSDGKARLWNADCGDPVGPAAVHGSNVWSVAFSSDGRLFLTYGEDQTVRLWETKSGRSVSPCFGHGGKSGPRFSPEGRWVVCGDSGGTARLWDVASGEPVASAFRTAAQSTQRCFRPTAVGSPLAAPTGSLGSGTPPPAGGPDHPCATVDASAWWFSRPTASWF